MIRPAEKTGHCHWCQRDRLELVLRDEISIAELDRWNDHISTCKICRDQLEELASQPQEWTDTRDALSLTTDPSPYDKVDDPSESAVKNASTKRMLLAWLDPPAADDGNESLGHLKNYDIRRVIGFGGMGVVLEAWDSALHRVVAIKAMHPHLAAIGTARQRFIREARAAAAIVNPNVVPIHSVDADHQPPFLSMQLVRGETLQSRIDREGPMTVEVALRTAYQIAEGLAAAHSQGLAHRDVKPANILLESGTERALLTDFGVARALDDATVTASGSIAGTPEYMSPEQARGESVDARSDQFSFGSVLYFMLTGRAPFRADSPMAVLKRVQLAQARRLHDIDPRLPSWIQNVIDRLHSLSPHDRFQDATQLATVLRLCLAHVLDPTRRHLPASLKWRAHPALLLVAVFLVISVLALSIGQASTWFYHQPINQGSDTSPSQSSNDREPEKLTEPLGATLESSQWEWDPWERWLLPLRKDIDRLDQRFDLRQ